MKCVTSICLILICRYQQVACFMQTGKQFHIALSNGAVPKKTVSCTACISDISMKSHCFYHHLFHHGSRILSPKLHHWQTEFIWRCCLFISWCIFLLVFQLKGNSIPKKAYVNNNINRQMEGSLWRYKKYVQCRTHFLLNRTICCFISVMPSSALCSVSYRWSLLQEYQHVHQAEVILLKSLSGPCTSCLMKYT